MKKLLMKWLLVWPLAVEVAIHRYTKGRMGRHKWREHKHQTGFTKRRCLICYKQEEGLWAPFNFKYNGSLKDFKRQVCRLLGRRTFAKR